MKTYLKKKELPYVAIEQNNIEKVHELLVNQSCEIDFSLVQCGARPSLY